jgi:hypothetical protein
MPFRKFGTGRETIYMVEAGGYRHNTTVYSPTRLILSLVSSPGQRPDRRCFDALEHLLVSTYATKGLSARLTARKVLDRYPGVNSGDSGLHASPRRVPCQSCKLSDSDTASRSYRYLCETLHSSSNLEVDFLLRSDKRLAFASVARI